MCQSHGHFFFCNYPLIKKESNFSVEVGWKSVEPHFSSIRYPQSSFCFILFSKSSSYMVYMDFAELLEIEAAKNWPCKSGQIPGTLRFDPLASQTSGLFVGKFTKLGI